MADRCFRPDEMESLLELAPGDSRLRHLADCPLCRARFAEYRAFIEEGAPADGSRPEQARADLEVFIAKMLRGEAGSTGGRDFRARLRALRVPRFVLIPGVAAAAVAVLILVAVLHPFTGMDQQQPPLRGLADSTEEKLSELVTTPAAVRGGAMSFSWSALPDADRYEVQIFDVNLESHARFDAGRDTVLEIKTDEISAASGPLWWRVAAFQGGDEFAHSSLSALRYDER